ncbi:MAG: guanylate kinase [Dehalococcoidia bacterium]
MVLSGPTAVGKTSVLRRMRELGLPYVIGVTMTTRAPRPGEVDGVDYRFVSREAFMALVDAGEMLEHAEVHRTNLYGIPRAPVAAALARGEDVIVPPDVQGAATVRAAVPGVVSIFLAPHTYADLERRIRLRGAERDEAEVRRRLDTARVELSRVDEFDYLVVNADGLLDETVRVIDAIITAERHRIGRPAVSLPPA